MLVIAITFIQKQPHNTVSPATIDHRSPQKWPESVERNISPLISRKEENTGANQGVYVVAQNSFAANIAVTAMMSKHRQDITPIHTSTAI